MLGCGNSSTSLVSYHVTRQPWARTCWMMVTRTLWVCISQRSSYEDGERSENRRLISFSDLDYSSVIIEKMRARVPELDWRIMDIRELEQHASTLGGPGTWDVIVDKGVYFLLFYLIYKQARWMPSWQRMGLCGILASKCSRMWQPKSRAFYSMHTRWSFVSVLTHSLLKPATGLFLYFTFGQPHFRRPHMQRDAWTIETRELGDMFHYYLYICRKHE